MTKWVKERGVTEVFNPGTGIGTFIRCAKESGISMSGVEVDYRLIKRIIATDVVVAPKVKHGDYLLLPYVERRGVICTPPITPVRRFYSSQADYKRVCSAISCPIHQTTYLYILWMYKGLIDIQGGGVLAFFVPSDFLLTATGSLVRDRLIATKSLHSIIRVADAEAVISADSDGLVIPREWVIVLADTRSETDAVSFKSCTMADLESKSGGDLIKVEALGAASSWQVFLTGCSVNNSLVPIKKYGVFRRGILSGANDFFALSRSDITNLGLRDDEVRRCIHKYTEAKSPVFTLLDSQTMEDSGTESFVFFASKKADEQSYGAKLYIEYGEKLELPKVNKLSQANPWYSFVHTFTPADFWLWVYVKDDYKLVMNRAGILNSSVFHGFFLNHNMREWASPLFLFLLSKVGKNLVNGGISKYKSRIKQYTVEALNSAMVPDISALSQIAGDAERYVDEVARTGVVPDELEEIINSL
jgi:adenine-specific DNA-methyltransferase